MADTAVAIEASAPATGAKKTSRQISPADLNRRKFLIVYLDILKFTISSIFICALYDILRGDLR